MTLETNDARLALKTRIDGFLAHCRHERNFSPHSLKAYRLDLDTFDKFLGERDCWASWVGLSRGTVRAYLGSLERFKPRTVRRRLATLKSFFGFLEREGVLEANPVRQLGASIRIGRPIPRTITLDSVRQLLEAAHANIDPNSDATTLKSANVKRDLAVLELLFASGMRVAELSHLKRADTDMDGGVVRVLGKGARERIIPICASEVLDAIRDHLAWRDSLTTKEPWLFLNRNGHRLSEQSIRRILRDTAETLGLAHVTPHMFRHTVATLLLEGGADLRYIQSFLGHGSITTTTIYTHVAQAAHRRALEASHPRRTFSMATPAPKAGKANGG